jgi:hypothetical protein
MRGRFFRAARSAGQLAEVSSLQTDGWADAGIAPPALKTNIKPIKASRTETFDIAASCQDRQPLRIRGRLVNHLDRMQTSLTTLP